MMVGPIAREILTPRNRMFPTIFAICFCFITTAHSLACISSSECNLGTANSCCGKICVVPWSEACEKSCAPGEEMKQQHYPMNFTGAGCAPIAECSMSSSCTSGQSCCSTENTTSEHPFGMCSSECKQGECVPGEKMKPSGQCINQYICGADSDCNSFGTLKHCCKGFCNTAWSSQCSKNVKNSTHTI